MNENYEQFTVKDDNTADWAVRQIKEQEEERDRLISIAENQIEELKNRIEELNAKCENNTSYLRSCLVSYFDTVPHKETKTQESYKLLSGSLVYKKPSVKINHDDEKLIEYLEDTEFIKVKKTVDWSAFKKDLMIDGDKVIDTVTGEIVEACTVEEVPASFNIKF